MCLAGMKETILPSHFDDNAPLILDASVVINLLATGVAGEVLAALRAKIIAERIAFDEVTRHPLPGLDHTSEMKALEASGLLLVQDMDEAARVIFRDITFDDLRGGLDDGEAATVALAVTHSSEAIPVIDERKAARIFRERWNGRAIIDSVTLLSDPRVTRSFSRAQLADAVYSALIYARMRVPSHARPWVDDLIGQERVATCSSLARNVRRVA